MRRICLGARRGRPRSDKKSFANGRKKRRGKSKKNENTSNMNARSTSRNRNTRTSSVPT